MSNDPGETSLFVVIPLGNTGAPSANEGVILDRTNVLARRSSTSYRAALRVLSAFFGLLIIDESGKRAYRTPFEPAYHDAFLLIHLQIEQHKLRTSTILPIQHLSVRNPNPYSLQAAIFQQLNSKISAGFFLIVCDLNLSKQSSIFKTLLSHNTWKHVSQVHLLRSSINSKLEISHSHWLRCVNVEQCI
ncbi:hypothetical protein CC1G_10978 [Coprinopsis cinerea okayama7|uniref:Uncharacterized protein n=1 Tax=Coprinopsis cinerea (strain Okayama-7 / 130 / ATCC MYA-4618 / FGSC 9003) TaxID=240176 RepID=A8PC27_COPC7|nr:hypothetical protein CC1G_10978 [Coprinopsis cinerea okayama7\|eukprot:XP_001840315.2 hypothetical protein CC1G_10978 [Coprinopsis cinerea okayama7\